MGKLIGSRQIPQVLGRFLIMVYEMICRRSASVTASVRLATPNFDRILLTWDLIVDELTVSRIFVDEGVTMKRFHARAKGRGARILKRTSHITVVVGSAK